MSYPQGPWRWIFPMDVPISDPMLSPPWAPDRHVEGGVFGEPQGTVARVHLSHIAVSISTTLRNKEHVIEAHMGLYHMGLYHMGQLQVP